MNGVDFQCVEEPAELSGVSRAVYALGTFDGVHLGHRRVLESVVELGRKCGAVPVAIFFDPSPREVLFPDSEPQRLMDADDKVKLMEKLGVGAVVRWPFSRELAALEPHDFMNRYFFADGAPAAAGFCVGEDWRFGRGNKGDVQTLGQLAAEHGAEVVVVPHFCDGEGRISSTRIRQLLREGRLAEAESLLGHPFRLTGTVRSGAGIAGGKLQCPTANLQDRRMLLPPYGVYAALVGIEEEEPARPGIVYVGDAPTVRGAGNGTPIVEIHLFDFNGDLYGRRVSVQPAGFLRPSIHFPDQESLKAQIALDVEETRRILKL